MHLLCTSKCFFMIEQNQHLDSLRDIKTLMDKSSRFISLSGWSGVAAGVCALIASIIAHQKLKQYVFENSDSYPEMQGPYIFRDGHILLRNQLLWLAVATFIVALALAFLFTYLRSRKAGVPIWGFTARRVLINVMVPMVVGGILILKMLDLEYYQLIASTSLFFYGLALINASKYTLTEIRYLGFGQLILGLINLWLVGYGLYFWAAGFGLLHIIYGIIMWNKYERNN